MVPTSVRMLVLAAAAVAALQARPLEAAQGGGARSAEVPTVVVHGEGEVKATPDQAFVTIGAETRAKIARDAQAQASTAMQAVQQRVTALGIAKDAVRTIAYDVQPEYDYVSGRQVMRGYFARHMVEVRVDDLARLGELLEGAVATGATTVQGVRFDLKQREQLERQALTRAVADARARAEAAASGAGMQVAGVVRIDEGGARVYPVASPMPMRAAMVADAAPAPPVAPGETVVRASVTLTAALK